MSASPQLDGASADGRASPDAERPPILKLPEVGSTNDEARARLPARPGAALWVVAERQTAGRGRRARAWHSGEGNLHASFAFCEGSHTAPRPLLPFAAAVALARALAALGVAPQLKWPNDVMVDGEKVAGILIETETTGNLRTTVIGVGVNVVDAPPGIGATAVRRHAPSATAADVFDHLVPALADTLTLADRDLRERWLERAIGIGRTIEVRLPRETRRGVFEALDAAGLLVLRRADGTRERIAAGDVFVAPAS